MAMGIPDLRFINRKVRVGYKPTGTKQAASRLLTNVDVRERVLNSKKPRLDLRRKE